MNSFDNLRGHLILREIAEKIDATPEQVSQDIQACIDEAWISEDPNIKACQARFFPNGQPSPEEFICKVMERLTQALGEEE